MTEEDSRPAISVRARFERFPATVKGAFIVRGEDANPHLIDFVEAHVVPVGGSRDGGPAGMTIPMKPVALDAPPHQDIFLPFEFSITDLESGWYDVTCDLRVDSEAQTFDGGRRFVVPWPRGATRRGPVALGDPLTLGTTTVEFVSLEGTGEHALLRYLVIPAKSKVTFIINAEDDLLPELESEYDRETGEGTVSLFPLLRAHNSLTITARTSKTNEATTTLALD